MRTISVAALICLIAVSFGSAQSSIKIDEIVITATKTSRSNFWTPGSISLLKGDDLNRAEFFSSTTPDMLSELPGVFAQVTTPGQGSPFLRNLTGYHTLMMVDGVRLNNSTFRSGPNQYLATIPKLGIQRLEVLRGSSSTLYGSSAMGGVINISLREPEPTSKLSLRPMLQTKFSSANESKSLGLGFELGTPRIALIAQGIMQDVGDVHPGKGSDIIFDTRKFIITSDPDPVVPAGARVVDVESPTAWKGYGGNAKLKAKSGVGDFSVTYQMFHQDEVPRYDKVSTGEYETYLFKPQNRQMLVGRYDRGNANIIVSYHRQEEGRESQKSGGTKLSIVSDTVHTLGVSGQYSIIPGPHRITTGFDFYWDQLESWSESHNTETGEITRSTWGRFPDGSGFWDANLFGQAELNIAPRLQAIAGLRLTRFHTNADLSMRSPYFGVLDSSGNALTGRVGFVFSLLKEVNVYADISQGFRAPSLNDTTAVEVTNEGIDAPNPDLGSERSLSTEIGFKFQSDQFWGSVAASNMNISGLISRVPIEEYFGDQEIPEFYVNLQKEYPDTDIFVHDNINESVIRCIEVEGYLKPIENVIIHGNFSITRGEDKSTGEPLRREQPPKGLIGLLLNIPGKAWLDLTLRGAAKQTRLSSGDIRDPRIPGTTRDSSVDDPQAGTPGWFIVNLKVGTQIFGGWQVTAGVENIFNRRYREHGSGVNGLGRSLVFSIGNGI